MVSVKLDEVLSINSEELELKQLKANTENKGIIL
tara:strand:- start:381 stop:482 length:102 start_codon:yes stop_codon:yes gene_type:complete